MSGTEGKSAAKQLAPAPESLPQCWAQIGVYGNRSCPELKDYIHCRNCPVYARVGSDLLDRPLPPDYRKRWTEHFANERPLRDFSSNSAVPFRIGADWLAFPTDCLQEITERRAIHSVPHSSEIVLGVVNVRGELLICVSLGQALGLPHLPPRNLLRADYQRLLVVSRNSDRLAFPVDEVQGPERFYPENVKPGSALLAHANPAYCESIIQWQKNTVVLLDVDLVFSAVNRMLA